MMLFQRLKNLRLQVFYYLKVQILRSSLRMTMFKFFGSSEIVAPNLFGAVFLSQLKSALLSTT